MVKQFRDYIKAKYGTQYSTLSDLFLGVDASYDADEMIALMRIVKVSPYALTGNASTVMVPFVPREYNNQRCEDLFRWGAQLFGVRGLESRCSYLYIDSTGKIRDARGQSETVTLIDNLNKLYNEGLILENYTSDSGYGVTNGKWAESIVVGGNTNYSGFMEYDYSQTQGVWNDKEGSKNIKGYDFRPIIGGVAKWDDGDSSTNYFQFTESWRSVKTQGWCLNASLKNDQAKLLRALAVADYFYSDAGQQLNSFGPESEGYTEGTIDYQGRTVAKFTDKALEQLNDSNIGKGSYTDYLRKYVGATLPVGYVKEQGMEYQCTSENSKNGLSIINKALELGTFKHVECSLTENPFYTVVPSAFNLDASQVSTKSDAETSSKLGSINSNGSSTSWNIWNNYVIYGFGGKKGDTTLETKDEYLEMVKNWGVASLETIYNDAYYLMTLDYKN
jgi:putative aldouronate transport system substrate-binding protein